MGMENGHFEHFRLMSQKWADVTEMRAKVTWSEIAVGWGRQYQCTVPCANGWLHRQLDDKASRCCRWWVVLPREDEVTLRYGYLYWKLSFGTKWWSLSAHKVSDTTFQCQCKLKRLPSKHKIFVQHFYKVGSTSKTLGRRCTNVIQMFCVCWDVR